MSCLKWSIFPFSPNWPSSTHGPRACCGKDEKNCLSSLEFLRCLWLLKKPCANPRFNRHLGTFVFFRHRLPKVQIINLPTIKLSHTHTHTHTHTYIYIYIYLSFKVCFQSHNILVLIWWSSDQRHTNNHYNPPCNEFKEIWVPINLDMIYHNFICSILFVLMPFAFV